MSSLADEGAEPSPPEKFDIAAAAFHVFTYAGETGWAPLLKLGGFYLAFWFVAGALLIWGVYPIFLAIFTQDVDPQILSSAPSRLLLVMLEVWIGFIVVYALTDAALLRWMLGRGARLRAGPDELRLLLIGVLWGVAAFIFQLSCWLLLALVIEFPAMGFVLLLILTVGVLVFVWVKSSVRLTALAASAVQNGAVNPGAVWRRSRPVYWPLFCAFAISIGLFVSLSFVRQMLSLGVFMTAGGARLMLTPDSELEGEAYLAALHDVFTNPVLIAGGVVDLALFAITMFIFQAMLAGVNAYHVRRPPT